MQINQFDYNLPGEFIAQEPVESRDHSRLMVINRRSGSILHKKFFEVLDYLSPGDALVMNNTKVIPARLYGNKVDTGARIEVVLLHRRDLNHWETLVRPGKRVKLGTEIVFGNGVLKAKTVDYTPAGGRVLEFTFQGNFEANLDQLGEMPLPPYINQQIKDPSRYQTVYAKYRGSAAAPTAGLHFTEQLLANIQQRGIEIVELLLHVGLGTFRPVQVEEIEKHQMHAEYYKIEEKAANKINSIKAGGGRIVAVGTTTVRTLETTAANDGYIRAQEGWTDIFIYPGYSFKIIDSLITNFHLPKSTLLMLVSALAGTELIKKAYQEAVETNYRFFSFGDAMIII